VVLRHKLNDKIIHGENCKRKMETETGFRFGTRHPRESINESLSGKWKRKPVSVSEPDIPESQSMRVCLWSIVVNSENSDPAKNKRVNLPAAGKFTRGQKKKIPVLGEVGRRKGGEGDMARLIIQSHQHRTLFAHACRQAC
jgi:hypothetical protein